MITNQKRFKVALSFPGEKRGFVEQTADCLAQRFGQAHVLYDAYHEAEFSRPNLDIHLPPLYHDESDLIAVFLCKEYQKAWCGLEWRACRDLINNRHESSVMLFRFDDTEIPGLYPTTDGYVWIGDRKATEIAELIAKRLEINTKDGIPVSKRSPGLVTSPAPIAPSRLRSGATPDHLFGREDELASLDQSWTDPSTHIVTLIAWGGVGKTALASHWAANLAKRNYDGASYFDWTFYSQGTRDQGAASADTFIKAALLFFGDTEMAESAAPAWDKGARLAQLVAKRRTLLILDGMEPLQHPPGPMTGQLKDPAITALLKGLAQNNPGLCVVTTRERVTDLDAFSESTVQQWELRHLSVPAGVGLLKQLGVKGMEEEFKRLVQDVDGHALTLHLLGRYLAKAHKGDIRKRDLVRFEKADARIQGGHAFRMLEVYEQWLKVEHEDSARALAILRLLGLFDRPADAGCIGALRRLPVIEGLTEAIAGIGEEDWNLGVACLVDCKLVSVTEVSSAIDAHPLVREYFAKQLREKNNAAWKEGHRRLYEYLTTSTQDKPKPTLEELQPLYQAVAHGCKAGLHAEARAKVYRDRILKGTGSGGNYSTFKLGAIGADLGAVACFFEEPWKKLSSALSEGDQAWLLNEAAFRLRALGRLSEAVEPMRAGLENYAKQKDWKNAAITANNLSELELTLGSLDPAIRDARQSVEFADKSGDTFWKMGLRTTLADALHQSGQQAEALTLFREAEVMQAEWQPEYPLLYSLQGFRYCDLLLARVEQSAWQRVCKYQGRTGNDGGEGKEEDRNGCREVEKRAIQTIKIAERNNWLLDIALDHLTLGRAGLSLSLLDPTVPALQQSTIDNINAAVNGLRAAGQQDDLPRGLLTRSLLHFLQNAPSASRADLDEAQQIADRGQMLLYLADVHLHRGRLYREKSELAKARELIEKCGYWRRKGELEDAEESAKTWQ